MTMREGHFRWDDEEYQLVIDNPDWSLAQLAEALDRSKMSVRNVRLRLRKGWRPEPNWWTPQEDDFILATPHLTAAQVGKRLERTQAAITSRRHLLSKARGGVSFGGRNKNPNHVGQRTLVARSCNKCDRILPGDMFPTVGQGRRKPWCKKCEPVRVGQPNKPESLKKVLQSKASKAKLQAMTIPAERHGEPWLDADIKVLADPDMTILEKAILLGRTWQATASACHAGGHLSKLMHAVGEDGEWHVQKGVAA